MDTPHSGLTQRARLLNADLRRISRQAQCVGSGATVHKVVNELSTAVGALQLFHAHTSGTTYDYLDSLLDVTEESLRELRVIVVRTRHT